MCRYVYDMPLYQISIPCLVISEAFFVESKEAFEWKRTLALTSVNVNNPMKLLNILPYDTIVWCLKIQGGKFILSRK